MASLKHWSQAEEQQLERGHAVLGSCSPQLLVPFEVHRLKNLQVVWINRRWFLERQFDVNSHLTRRRIIAWLKDEFGYAVPGNSDPPGAFSKETTVWYADRYGSSTGRTVHGGSGRVATIGAFQAKGIGLTPLAGASADPEYSNGCCSVEEAIREAIFAEVTTAEFPHGALPVVAVLATDLLFSEPPTRRGILIRPAVLRLAHFERAPLFRESITGFANSQLDDVTRTRDVVRKLVAQPSTELPELVRRIAEQVAFSQVHRVFSGGFFSSNLAADGALMDFGGTRGLPNWANARNLDGVVGFGDEMQIVGKVIESISFFFTKYGSPHFESTYGSHLRAIARSVYEHAFTRELLRIWNLDGSESAAPNTVILKAMRRYFSAQQRHRVNYKHGATNRFPWLHNGDSLDFSEPSGTLKAIGLAMRQHFAAFPDGGERIRRAVLTACRYLMPRTGLNRELLRQRIERLLEECTLTDAPCEWLDDFMQATISGARRHWPALPNTLAVVAHVSFDGSSALLCEGHELRKVYWLEGIRVGDRLLLFDTELPMGHAPEMHTEVDGRHWRAIIRASEHESLTCLRLPKMSTNYSNSFDTEAGGL